MIGQVCNPNYTEDTEFINRRTLVGGEPQAKTPDPMQKNN
jgi:hypothetical protein